MNPPIEQRLHVVLSLIASHRALWAFVSWPLFSFTSYMMVSRLLRQGLAPRTVLDIGANAGQFTVTAAKLFSGVTVHSFEPIPSVVRELARNVRTLHNVRVHPMALGDTDGHVEFHVNTHSHSSSILKLGQAHLTAFPDATEQKTISVPVSTLDNALANVRLVRPALLKVDVQGYEMRVLAGAKHALKQMDYVILESSFRPLYEGELLFMDLVEAMIQRGFTFLRPVGSLCHPGTGEVLQIDALFGRRD